MSKIVLNKIFTGSYLKQNLGHEIKNFIVLDDNTRGVWITPYGQCKNVEYAIHVMESNQKIKNCFEVIAISKIKHNSDLTSNDYMNKTLYGVKLSNIFKEAYKKDFQELSFDCENFYTIKLNKKIVINLGQSKANIVTKNDHEIILNITMNFGQAQGMHIYPENNNERIIETILDNIDEYFIKEPNTTSDLSYFPSELPYCIISERVSLELSVSNLITYFLKRDPNLFIKFLTNFLKINLDDNECFEIEREENNIDIIIKSNKHVIVIENKIDSKINGIKNNNYSQLTKYFNYVNEKYKELQHHFFILKPDYNYIDSNTLNEQQHGDKYIIKTYSELYDTIIADHDYCIQDQYAQFLFNEFKTNIMYLTWTKAKQIQYTSFIKLKQKILDLKK